MENEEYLLLPNLWYIHKLDHRNNSRDKSQWLITKSNERSCFLWAHNNQQNITITCWGLHFVESVVEYLGKTKSAAPEQRDLFIAKFIDTNHTGKWHGYPADHVLNQQDIPPENTLAVWLEANYLKPAVVRKITRGQKCRLRN